jgi:hypothetical protein
MKDAVHGLSGESAASMQANMRFNPELAKTNPYFNRKKEKER